MNNTLFLTSTEKKLFDALSDDLKDGWEVKVEEGKFEDDPVKRLTRLQLAQLHDPNLLAFVEEAKKKDNVDDLADLLLETDLNDITDGDLAELFFVLGPAPISAVIIPLLQKVKTDDDLEDIMALGVIRNSLLNAHQSTSQSK